MTEHETLRQQLLELAYDLLDPAEAERLRTRIAAEPEVAAMDRQVRRSLELLGSAAKLAAPPVSLVVPDEAPTRAASPRRSALGEFSWSLVAERLLAVAAVALVALTLGLYLRHASGEVDVAARHVRMVVSGPATMQPGVDRKYQVEATSAVGKPVSVPVELTLYSPDGKRLFQQRQRTTHRGRATLVIPAATAYAPANRLELVALADGQPARTETTLLAERPRFVTQLSLDKPLYQPGDVVRYRSLTLDRFGLNATVDVPVQFKLLDPSGATVPNSELAGLTDHGVGSGEFALPEEIAGGQFTLVAASPQQAFPEEQRPFFVRQYRVPRLKKELEFGRDSYSPGDRVTADFSAHRAEGGPAAGAKLRIVATVDGAEVHRAEAQATAAGTLQVEFKLPEQLDRGDGQLAIVVDDGGTQETIAETIPINLGKVDVKFYPESGDLVAGLENRVYVSARNLVGKPVSLQARVLDSQSREVARLETAYKGLGAFQFTPQRGETYKLAIDQPSGMPSQPELPKTNDERFLVFSTGGGVFEPGKPIDVSLTSTKDDVPLVIAAYCRGVQVGTHALPARKAAQRAAVALAEQASGVVRLTVFDASQQPPRPIAERLVYRRPQRKLNVRVADHAERYAPGEPVQMSLIVTNEKGEAIPAVLGVAVTDDSLLKLADDDKPSLTTHLLLTTEVEKPADLEKADFYLSADAKAPQALDLLLGAQGWRRFVERTLDELRKTNESREDLTRLAALGGTGTPPVISDNLRQVEGPYRAELNAYQARRASERRSLGRVAVVGAVLLVVGWVAVASARALSSIRVWGPALAAAGACLVAGLVWLGASPAGPPRLALAGYRNFQLTPALAPGDAVPIDAWYKNSNWGFDRWDASYFDADGDGIVHWKELGVVAGNGVLWDDYLAEGRGIRTRRTRGRLNIDDLERTAEQGRPVEQYFLHFGGAPAGERRTGKRQQGQFAGVEFDLAARIDPGGGVADRREHGFAYRAAANGRGLWRRGGIVGGGAGAKLDVGAGFGFGRDEFVVPPQGIASFTFREYAHQHVAAERPELRSDFAETVYWHPRLATDDAGKAQVKFQLSDAVTTFRVLANAHAAVAAGNQGRIGSGSGEIISRIPLSVEPKLPLEVTAGDRLEVPVAVNNDSSGELPVQLSLAAGELLRLSGAAQRQLRLAPGSRHRETFTLEVVGQAGSANVEVRGVAGALADGKRQAIKVVPPGFPVAETYAGRLSGQQQVTVRLPKDWVPGSLEVSLSAYPSTLAELKKGLENMLREPTGCFEQASTSNYPNVLSLQYLQQHRVANPEVTRRAKELLKTGYGRLAGYECKAQGYEWFGSDPGHEALSAYGLMQFRDMAEVYDVDRAMIDRTAKWLLARRDGKGSFQRNPRALDSFGSAPQHITDAYIVWALCESGQKGIERELAHVLELGRKSEDPYLLALAGNSAVCAGEAATGKLLLDKLAKAQAADGHLDGKEGSITRSGGISLSVETTALAALAWLKLPDYHAYAEKAIEWIGKNRQEGGFGSTQGTILALKALVEHAKAHRKSVAAGELVVRRGNVEIGKQAFGAGHDNTISIDGLAAKLEPGDNQLTIHISGDNQMPYTLDVSYRAGTPLGHAACPVRLATALGSARVRAGETVPLAATLSNATDQGQPMTVAILGLPAGLQARANQLEELKKAGTIDYYETRAREVICYWRSLAPRRKVDVKLDLVAEWPGRYTAPASRAYLYYTAEQKHWVEPVSVEITRP